MEEKERHCRNRKSQATVCAELPVDVFPVDCIHPTKNEAEAFPQVHQLYIDPEECIDCGACEPVCPV